MTDYSTGKIYALYIPGLDEVCYVGSTTNTLEWRLSHHKHSASNDAQTKCVATLLFEEENDVQIKLIESFPCDSRRALEERERYWIEQFPDCVNKNIPTRGWKERWLLNRERNIAKHKEWIEANKEQQAEYKKLKRETNLELARQKDKESNARRDKEKRKLWKQAVVVCSSCQQQLKRDSFTSHKKAKHPNEDVSYTLL